MYTMRLMSLDVLTVQLEFSSHTQTYMQTDIHTYTRTYIHTDRYTYIHIYTHTYIHTHTCIAWLTSNCGRICAIGSSPSNGLKPNLWGQKGFNPLCQCVYVYVCIVKPDIQTIHRGSHTSIHTYIHTYINTYIPKYIHAYIHQYIHTYTHTSIHTYLNTYIHT